MSTSPEFNTTPHPERHMGLLKTKSSSDIVGIISPGYAVEKTTYGLPTQRFRYRKMYRAPIHRLEKNSSFFKNTPIILDNSVALLHTFNEIPISTHPFIITFENELPRYLNANKPWQMNVAYKMLASDRCKNLLSISQICADMAIKKFSLLGMEKIAKKIQVFRGGVLSSTNESEREIPKKDTPIKAIFVGGNAFSKGLIPTVEAIQQCRKQGINVELTVISHIQSGKGYTLKEFTPSVDVWKKELEDLTFIRYISGLPNYLVRKEMADHEILLFPSFDESLGWVIVEAGLEGLCTLATNIYAIPELIEDDVSGFFVKIKLAKENRWQGIWENGTLLADSIENAYDRIRTKIIKVMHRISQDRSLTIEMGINAKKHMDKLYNIKKAANTIEMIYQNALM